MSRLSLIAAVIAAFISISFLAAPASAQNISVAAFKGSWSGSAVANNRDSLYFGVTIRDLNVTITPVANGFKIGWTTVIRRGGTPDKPRIRKKSVELMFVATGKPRVYRLQNNGDMLKGSPYGWARIDKRTLVVYLMEIDDRGTYAISRYARTLSGGGMDLEFSRLRDGEPTRVVRGKLVRDR